MTDQDKRAIISGILRKYGYPDAQVVLDNNTVQIQLSDQDIDRLLLSDDRDAVIAEIKAQDVYYVTVDLSPLE